MFARPTRRLFSSTAARPALIFPGCGIFFWWQAGTVSALAKRLDLDKAQMAGASGGALSATLAGSGVTDSEASLAVALRLCERIGAFERGAWALRGIWSDLVKVWLNELLPPDAHTRCSGRVHILLYRPFYGTSLVSEFSTRDDLIAACLASVHIPFYMDGSLTREFRGGRYIDSDIGALTRTSSAAKLEIPGEPASVRIARGRDRRLREKYSSASDVLALVSADGVREMVRWGAEHVEELDAKGTLWQLDGIRREPWADKASA